MLPVVFDRVPEGIIGIWIFVQRYNASTKPVTGSRIQIIVELRTPSYGLSFDHIDEVLQISECFATKIFLEFVKQFVSAFGDAYLCKPFEADLRRFLRVNQGRGFPGCSGSWDCQH